jgi:serine/threonine protein kinase
MLLVLYTEGGCNCHCVPQNYTKRWLLTDFGFSTNIESGRIGFSNVRRGTPGYRAPELADVTFDKDGKEKPAEYTRNADIWAIGCIIMQVATCRKSTAFGAGGDLEVVNFARGHIGLPQICDVDNPLLKRETFCPETSSILPFWRQLNSVVQRCLTPQPVDRITSMDLKAYFEKMKLYLIIDASEDERKHWLAGGGIQHDNSLTATTNA